MFEFDWSIVTELKHVFAYLKAFYGIISYDPALNKFWLRDDYNAPLALDYEDITEMLDQFDIAINEECQFLNGVKKFRSTVLTPVSKRVSVFYDDRETVKHFSVRTALSLLEKKLQNRELRRPVIS